MKILLLLIAIVLLLLLRRVLVTIRLKGKIKWIAGGYVVVLIIIAIIVSCKTPTLRDATEAQLRQAAAQQADLRKGKISLPVRQTWTQKIDPSKPFLIDTTVFSSYKVVENHQLKDRVRVTLYDNTLIFNDIDYTPANIQVDVRTGDEGFSLEVPEMYPQNIHVLTDRLFYIDGQLHLFEDEGAKAFGIFLVKVEVPKGVHVEAEGLFNQMD
ncbi:hypothetical protein [Kurthia massiliensis]|uniref:hypothetical protein n=1 Tax=Kurthia massiliensis TaxID=1033739 RepID=UPI000287E0C4|nr:hypothetical protein [Kurthia massiliensis]